ncbi:SDR family oxidoreductase [Euryhalocaulis caribicus]|uniref:SDR family oxidoreductase n=1 Tax=Euryhalocaulis caribicus TaxID=1161401 RepID=UPI000399C140|nr:SDR family oxidoreductase [Euryhalocaulis caribicus]
MSGIEKLEGGPPRQSQDSLPGRETELDPPPDYEPKFRGSDRLKGKSCIITGGDSGIGRAICVLFAREGADVAFLYKGEEEDEDAKKTVALIEREGGKAFCRRGDVGEEKFCKQFIADTVREFGGLNVLVNNAAEQHVDEHLEDISTEQFERTLKTNVMGYFFMTKHALPHLEKGDAIVNTVSITAYKGQPVLVDYSVTRGGMVAFTRSLCQQLTDKGIRVNGVAPGPIWTPLNPASFEAGQVEEFGADTPMGRPGMPNEVAPCHLFLACADSSYMTGQVLHPNGGTVVGG